MDPDIINLLLVHHQDLGHVWARSILSRLENHDIKTDIAILGKEDYDASSIISDIIEIRACAICVNARTPSQWLSTVLEQIRSGINPPRVFPVLLPGASDGLVIEFWPQWDWIDFRTPEDHEDALSHLVKAALGKVHDETPKDTAFGSGLGGLSKYERRIHGLKRLRSAGLEEEIYFETQRKLAARWIDDPEWEKP